MDDTFVFKNENKFYQILLPKYYILYKPEDDYINLSNYLLSINSISEDIKGIINNFIEKLKIKSFDVLNILKELFVDFLYENSIVPENNTVLIME
jgi:hypothetical protein